MKLEKIIVTELQQALNNNLLKKWYPLVIDEACGGYFTNLASDWTIVPEQEKMIVSQARHVWTTSKAAGFYDDAGSYERMARHGYTFLKNTMWDSVNGGFYQIRNRQGSPSNVAGWRDEKRTYGNAFGLYALAALYKQIRDPEVMEFAKKVFYWIEDHAFDAKDNGYFEFLTGDSNVFDLTSEYQTIADDGNELGFKDQNSSIHLLEAYTELYHVWKDDRLKTQLRGLMELIRDVMVNEKGYLHLFFHTDWTPVSFRTFPAEVREQNYGLDHVSFGHDYETAFLLLEASFELGIENDTKTLAVAKKMLDHALQFGFDRTTGGFFDAGYYFSMSDECTIIKETKNWWAQAEALNALLLFSLIYPNEKQYAKTFAKQWKYVQTYVLDHQRGDWYEGGLDKEPHFRTGPKSHMWKCTYHTSRALMNCITLLSNEALLVPESNLTRRRHEMNAFIAHWKRVASYC
jgi:cellobiose epimerase